MIDQHSFRKKWIEETARLILCKYAGMSESDLFLADKPDLQDKVHSLGIEVVAECTPEVRLNEDAAQQYFGRAMNSIPARSRKRFDDSGIELHEIGGKIIASSHELINDQSRLLNTIKSKISKLGKGNYSDFSTNGLFVHCETTVTQSSRDSIEHSIVCAEVDYTFDNLFLFDWRGLYVFNSKIKHWSFTPISHEDYILLIKEAKENCM